ncbi:ribonuclease J [Tsukamurella ocularis]|uniref:ribonuclease J n=1 Tax=Tsukamurella ocularis TaxID=1970234 RepID=UPI00286E1670|nr:ribonuclease J [Tsukamurella ocularis]MCS3780168.1 ribonuclease J [Tsukamurella ocularis]MCS3786278.1 ribonuclease J [Tsukamurella ocularis]MCS3849642.1 ribonuclease J [Tsukamurella ocularis]
MTDGAAGGARRSRKATRQAGPPAEPKPVIATSAARVVAQNSATAPAVQAPPTQAPATTAAAKAPAAKAETQQPRKAAPKGGGNRRGGAGRRGGGQKAPSAAVERLGAPPKLPKGGMRIVALGGIKEIGRNMTVFEYDGKLLVVDCGVLFPEDQQPGVDLILPDFRYIEDRIKDVEAIVLTHGHEDHIGAVPFLLRLRPDIPVVGAKFTLALVKAKCDEHRLRPKLIEVREGESTSHGPFECEYFAVNHSIPDAIAVAIHAGGQVALHTGDIKLDQLPLDGRLTDLAGFSRLGDAGVDLFLVDSTNAEVPGFVTPEREIGPVLDNVIGRAKGRVIVASFASHVHRIQQIAEVAMAHNRRITFVGRSMVRNMALAQDLGYMHLPEGVEVDLDTAASLPDDRVVLISTGSQGEPLAALSRMARGEHRNITISPNDLVVLASSLIPGNENSVFAVVNGLSKLGAKVITQQSAKVHVSGHASAGELLYLYNAVRPRNAMPVHGEWRHLRANAALAEATGVPKDRIMLAEDGVVVDLVGGVAKIVGQVPVGHVYVDGSSVGDVGESTLSDRLVLGEGGFIAITVAIDERGNAVTKPEVSGRGFSDDPTALKEAEQIVEDVIADLAAEGVKEAHRIAQGVRRAVGRWVDKAYRRRPMIVPTVIVVGE